MKVQLIVVQGKPEGKVIPLTIPRFKIGRGETCHLRPNSEQVSREHAEFIIAGDVVKVRDLGSRNGTLVNGKAVTEPTALKDRDLVTIGHLTFAVAIEGAPAAPKAAPAPAAPAAKPAPPKASALDEATGDDIDSWLISDQAKPTPESPSGVYGGETITIAAFKDAGNAARAEAAAKPQPADDGEFERVADEEEQDEESEDSGDDEDEDDEDASANLDEMPEDFIDESNPFFVKKKKAEDKPSKPEFKDTADAASDILRKMMERRKANQ